MENHAAFRVAMSLIHNIRFGQLGEKENYNESTPGQIYQLVVELSEDCRKTPETDMWRKESVNSA